MHTSPYSRIRTFKFPAMHPATDLFSNLSTYPFTTGVQDGYGSVCGPVDTIYTVGTKSHCLPSASYNPKVSLARFACDIMFVFYFV